MILGPPLEEHNPPFLYFGMIFMKRDSKEERDDMALFLSAYLIRCCFSRLIAIGDELFLYAYTFNLIP